MTLVERFLKYVSFDTQSNEESGVTPSTPGQMVFARFLKEELEALGLEEITLDENGYLFATLPANIDKSVPVVGFIAHMDTSPDMSGKDVSPRIVENYDGKDIVLCADEQVVLSPARFPELLDHKGEDLIVTNGKTLLGADDKAGIAEIVSAVAYLKEHPEIKHGKIRIGFNPDEEIGLGAHKFNVEQFGCEWAYTMDGGEVGELEFENFNAASAKIVFKGRNVHPGYAKNKMINSIRVANRFISMLPSHETPEHTEGYEGFYHLIGITGEVEQTTVTYIIRDHDRVRFESRKKEFEHLVCKINAEYGEGTAALVLHGQYGVPARSANRSQRQRQLHGKQPHRRFETVSDTYARQNLRERQGKGSEERQFHLHAERAKGKSQSVFAASAVRRQNRAETGQSVCGRRLRSRWPVEYGTQLCAVLRKRYLQFWQWTNHDRRFTETARR